MGAKVIWILVFAGLLAGCTAAVWYVQNNRREKELAEISEMIAGVLNGNLPLREAANGRSVLNRDSMSGESGEEETLVSKIYCQLMRLREITEGYHREVEKERDGIQKLISEIAHQLRTPLANIETYMELLQDESISSEEQKKYLQAVGTAEEKLHFLVESFIKMSRLENHIIQIRRENLDLAGTVRGAAEQARKKAEEKELTIEISGPEHMEYPHDPNWMEEAVYNLLDNAVKYSERGGRIIVSLEQNEMFALIQVQDYGTGICAGEESKVFDRFYRGRNVTTQEGFGIGLYLAREIVNQHGGFIRLKRLAKGSLFEVYLAKGQEENA